LRGTTASSGVAGDFVPRELRLALIAWQQKTYNERWLIERRGHRSPQVRREHYAKLHGNLFVVVMSNG